MSQLTVKSDKSLSAAGAGARDDYDAWRWYMLPLVFAFVIDFFAPQLVGWRLLPRSVLLLSDIAIAAMMIIVVMRMLLLDHIPLAFLIVLAASLIGIAVALFEGQSAGITAVGWRRLFQYPLIGLYVYLMPQWPPKSATWILRLCLLALGFNTFVQLALFATGEPVSDSLAGMFGISHGAGQLIMFVLIVVSLGFGKWLALGDWHYLGLSLMLGAIASSLGSMKLFPVAVLVIALIAFSIQMIRIRYFGRLLKMLGVLIIGVVAFKYAFDLVAPYTVSDQGQRQNRPIEYYLDPAVLDSYLSGTTVSSLSGNRLGRNDAPIYVWNTNLKSPANFLFGKGIGSLTESNKLGITGTFKSTSLYNYAGKSLTVLLGETGLVGVLTFAFFCLAVIIVLYRRVAETGRTDFAALQYGVLLYTASWPLWLWYQPVWTQAIPMLLYWTLLGFTMNQANTQSVQEINGAA